MGTDLPRSTAPMGASVRRKESDIFIPSTPPFRGQGRVICAPAASLRPGPERCQPGSPGWPWGPGRACLRAPPAPARRPFPRLPAFSQAERSCTATRTSTAGSTGSSSTRARLCPSVQRARIGGRLHSLQRSSTAVQGSCTRSTPGRSASARISRIVAREWMRLPGPAAPSSAFSQAERSSTATRTSTAGSTGSTSTRARLCRNVQGA
jgi:hypothetical protein